MENKNTIDESNNYKKVWKYTMNQKYTEVTLEPDEIKYLPYLLECFGNMYGEFSSYALYLISRLSIENIDNSENLTEIIEIFKGIYEVEIVHLELLSKIIIKLGGSIKIQNSKRKEWKSSLIPYSNDLREILTNAYKFEYASVMQYKKYIGLIENDSMKKLFTEIMRDEELHLEIIKELYDNL